MSEVASKIYDLFAGRLDTYAIRVEFGDGETMYLPSTYSGDSEYASDKVEKITRKIGTTDFNEEVIQAHLNGDYFIGVYPITTDSTVRWFALDLDGENAWDDALEQAKILTEEAGLNVYIERSQSGNGYHIWGFLDGEMNAGRLRHALSPYVEKADTFDRMFPNQAGVTATRPLGNLIALPFHGGRMKKGNSSFVEVGKNGAPVVIKDQFAFLDEIELISLEKMEELYEEAGQYQPEREHTQYEGEAEGLGDSYKLTHERFGCEFVRWCWDHPEDVDEPLWYALLCNFAQLEDGRELAHKWSARDELRYNAHHTDKKYDQALRANKPHSCEVIRGLGGVCNCDLRFPGQVYHPFDLVKQPFKKLVESVGVDGELTNHVITAAEGFSQAFARIQQIDADPEAGQGLKYGIKSLDKATRLRDGELIVIAGRPGMGKSAASSSFAHNLAFTGVPNYYFSVEMVALQLFVRQTAIAAEVSLTRIATGQLTASDWKRIRDVQELVKDQSRYPLFVDDMSRSTDRIFEVAARLVHKHGHGVIWVDYLQLLQRLPKESMFDAVTRITQELLMLAKALNVPVVALVQLNRTADDATAESETYDSWLKGSGEIEQAASVIIFLLGEKGPGIKERLAIIHKERHRESGIRIPLEFNQPLMTFAEPGTWRSYSDLPTTKPEVPDEDDEEETFFYTIRPNNAKDIL